MYALEEEVEELGVLEAWKIRLVQCQQKSVRRRIKAAQIDTYS